MRAETWEKLNGSGWGQLLSEDANPSTIYDGSPPFAGEAMRTINDRPYDGEINIPGLCMKLRRVFWFLLRHTARREWGE